MMRARARTEWWAMLPLAALLAGTPCFAAGTPIPQINYQGVLRDAADAPLDGDYDMIFRFFSAPAGGDEILVDDWSMGVGGPVHVSKGLFNVALGAGFPTDGAGPGTYTALDQVFRDYSAVFLEVTIEGQVLTPRTLVLSAATALNAHRLDGKGTADFIDVSSTPQSKAGQLFCADGVYATSTSGGYGIESYGAVAGGFFKDADNTGFGWVGYGERGVHAGGLEMGGYFKDSDQSGYAEIGSGDYGLKAYGNTMGGRFQDLDGTGTAFAGYGDVGLYASGGEAGVFGFGTGAAGYGVHGQGFGAGGFFEDRNASGQATVGKDNRGIEGFGTEAGGYFKDSDSTGSAFVGFGSLGISASGSQAGAYFTDSDLADTGYAYLGIGDLGMEGFGPLAGGYFKDADSSGYLYAGYGDYGARGFGNTAGGYFKDLDESGYAFLGQGNIGVLGYGSYEGASFSQTVGSGQADIAWSDRGIQAVGNNAGAYFGSLTTSSFGLIGYSSYKIYGTGSMSFVQNHPVDKDRVIVYTAPEGDETATYTRGTARLVNGEARVALGETFAWVTNPDIGLSAYVTPRDRPVPLAVAALTTSDLIVRGPAGEDVIFDYLVYGLRLGFEEATVVQEKTQEARIPSMADHRRRFEEHPDLRRFTPLARFGGMPSSDGPPHHDGQAARALRAAVEEYDPAAHGRPRADREPASAPGRVTASADVPTPADSPTSQPAGSAPPRSPGPGAALQPDRQAPVLPAASVPPPSALVVAVRVSEAVETGDVLVVDPDNEGWMRRGSAASDRSVVGLVADGSAVAAREEILIAVSGMALCKVDASYGAIRAGDLLATSPTPGSAMRAGDAAAGAILGKALESLDAGRGLIRILVMPR